MLYSRLSPLALAATLTASLGAEAAEWVAEPTVTLGEEYNDNIRLTSADHSTVWGTVLDPRLILSRRSEVWDLNASGRLRAARYTGEDGLDTTDTYFDLTSKRQLERGSWTANASLVNDTTLQSQVLDLDTGLVNQQVDRSQKSLQISGEYLFTETDWLEASAGLTKIDYTDGEQYGLLDYDSMSPELTVVHQFDPQTQVFGVLSHSNVDYDTSTNLESKTDSLQLGASYDITETWKVRGSVGGRRTNTSSVIPTAEPRPGFEFLFPFVYDIVYVPRDSDSTGLVYDASLSRAFETGSVSLSGSQSVTPSSTGTDSETTAINLNATQNFSAKLSAQLAVSYYQSSTIGDVTTQADSTRYRISPSLTWHLDKDLALNAGYTYTRVEYDQAVYDSVDNNSAFVRIGYSWPRMAVSR